MAKVIIEFDSDDVAKEFVSWMDNQGEQDYWTYIEGTDDFTGESIATFEYGSMKKGTLVVKASGGTK